MLLARSDLQVVVRDVPRPPGDREGVESRSFAAEACPQLHPARVEQASGSAPLSRAPAARRPGCGSAPSRSARSRVRGYRTPGGAAWSEVSKRSRNGEGVTTGRSTVGSDLVRSTTTAMPARRSTRARATMKATRRRGRLARSVRLQRKFGCGGAEHCDGAAGLAEGGEIFEQCGQITHRESPDLRRRARCGAAGAPSTHGPARSLRDSRGRSTHPHTSDPRP